jgi:hypothetical protein
MYVDLPKGIRMWQKNYSTCGALYMNVRAFFKDPWINAIPKSNTMQYKLQKIK